MTPSPLSPDKQKTGGGLTEDKGLPVADGADEAPRTPVEIQLAAIWAQVLGFNEFGIHHRFIDLGGDSFSETLISSRIQDQFQVSLTIIQLFNAATIAEQALLITQKQAEALDPALLAAYLDSI